MLSIYSGADIDINAKIDDATKTKCYYWWQEATAEYSGRNALPNEPWHDDGGKKRYPNQGITDPNIVWMKDAPGYGLLRPYEKGKIRRLTLDGKEFVTIESISKKHADEQAASVHKEAADRKLVFHGQFKSHLMYVENGKESEKGMWTWGVRVEWPKKDKKADVTFDEIKWNKVKQ